MKTVDYGIDLGTTNSAIAKMTKRGAKIIRGRDQSPLIPSAVALNRQGQIVVGRDALKDPDFTVVSGFKRHMGTTTSLELSDNEFRTPVELSAEILKELKAAVKRRFDEELRHVVITVPAMFQQPQCQATSGAASLAGLEAVSLLQEPIAAATAYFSEEEPEEGHYLVYDLGGGTFDVSLIRLRDNHMAVVAHGGDNYLGGREFDRRLVEWVKRDLAEGLGILDDLDGPRETWILSQECEQAKIALTDEASATIDLGRLGISVPHLEIERATFEELIMDLVEKTLRLTCDRLESQGLSTGDLEGVILVGGPTQMPIIRRRLKEALGVPIFLEHDPMTVVAVGAAIHASRLVVDQQSESPVGSADSVELSLHFATVSPDDEVFISGKVADDRHLNSEVRFIRSGGDWETGWIALKNGAFVAELSLHQMGVTEFQLQVRSSTGSQMPATPPSISIRHGVESANPVTPYKYGVMLEDETTGWVIDHTTPLPAYGWRVFKSTHLVRANTSDRLNIYFLEGLSREAHDNVKVGELVICGEELERSLPADQEIEVRLWMDQSRILKARVYVPLVDKEYEVSFTSEIKKTDVPTLRASAEVAREIISQIDAGAADVTHIEAELTHLEAAIEKVAAGRAEVGEEERIEKQLSDLKAHARPLGHANRLEISYDEALGFLEKTERVCEIAEDARGLRVVEQLRRDAQQSYQTESVEGLKDVCSKARELFMSHYAQTPHFFLGFCEWLESREQHASNSSALHSAIGRAREAALGGDIEGARTFCAEALALLPESDQAESKSRNFSPGLKTA